MAPQLEELEVLVTSGAGLEKGLGSPVDEREALISPSTLSEPLTPPPTPTEYESVPYVPLKNEEEEYGLYKPIGDEYSTSIEEEEKEKEKEKESVVYTLLEDDLHRLGSQEKEDTKVLLAEEERERKGDDEEGQELYEVDGLQSEIENAEVLKSTEKVELPSLCEQDGTLPSFNEKGNLDATLSSFKEKRDYLSSSQKSTEFFFVHDDDEEANLLSNTTADDASSLDEKESLLSTSCEEAALLPPCKEEKPPGEIEEVEAGEEGEECISINVDEALKSTGCGRFQLLAQAIITFTVFAFSYHCTLSYFIASDPSWTCTSNNTSAFCKDNFGRVFATYDEQFQTRCQLARDEWKFITDDDYSIITEFDLVCERAPIAAFTSSAFHIGGSIGIFVFGILGDYLGRKKTLLVALNVLTVVSMACSFVCNATQLIVLRLLVGATTIPCYAFSYMYLSEFVTPRFRTIVVIVYSMGYVTSNFMLDTLAFYVRQWRQIQLYSTLPCIVAIFLLFLLPQSPRWLLVHDRKTDAEKTLVKIGKINRRPFEAISLRSQIAPGDRKYTYLDLVRSKKAALLTLPQLFLWFTVSMSFYTISFQSSNLGGDIYQAFALSTLAEVPSKVMGYYVCQYFGRKRSTIISLIMMSIFAVSTVFTPPGFDGKYICNMSLMMVAKFFADISVQGMYIWTFELYPTVLRGQGTAICIAFERLGSFTAPFLTSVLYQVNPKLPMILLVVFACLSACAGVLLRETNKKPTRERFEDMYYKVPKDVLLS